jgi:hypothetical protein
LKADLLEIVDLERSRNKIVATTFRIGVEAEASLSVVVDKESRTIVRRAAPFCENFCEIVLKLSRWTLVSNIQHISACP